MSKILITDIPLLADVSIEQQGIIVGGTTTDIGTNPVVNYIPLNPILETVLGGLGLNSGDLTNYLNGLGLNINFPTP